MRRTNAVFDKVLLEYFMEAIHSCVKSVSYVGIEPVEKMIMLGTNAASQQNNAISQIHKCNKVDGIVFVGQFQMRNAAKKSLGEQDSIVSWEKNYDDSIVDTLEGIDFPKCSFIFYSADVFDSRITNLLNIGEKLKAKGALEILCYDEAGDLYEFHNIPLFLETISMINGINRYIDVALEDMK